MTVHLLNSSVMPQPGSYQLWEITAEAFAAEVRAAAEDHELKHYIGYKSTLTFIEHLTSLDLGELHFEKAELKDGDMFLVVKLKYRPILSEKIADDPDIRDFRFYKGNYAQAYK